MGDVELEFKQLSKKVGKLESLKHELEVLDTRGFEPDVQFIKSKLHDVDGIPQIEHKLKELHNKIKKRLEEEQKQQLSVGKKGVRGCVQSVIKDKLSEARRKHAQLVLKKKIKVLQSEQKNWMKKLRSEYNEKNRRISKEFETTKNLWKKNLKKRNAILHDKLVKLTEQEKKLKSLKSQIRTKVHKEHEFLKKQLGVLHHREQMEAMKAQFNAERKFKSKEEELGVWYKKKIAHANRMFETDLEKQVSEARKKADEEAHDLFRRKEKQLRMELERKYEKRVTVLVQRKVRMMQKQKKRELRAELMEKARKVLR